MLSDVQVTEPVPCWGQGVDTCGMCSGTCVTVLSWVSPSPTMSQPHDSFQFQEGKTKTFSSDDSSGQQIRGKNKIHIHVNVWINPATFFLTFWYDFGTPSFPLTGTHFKLSTALLVWEGLFGIAVCTAESQSWLPWLHAKQWLIKISCCSRHSVDNNPHHSKGNVC